MNPQISPLLLALLTAQLSPGMAPAAGMSPDRGMLMPEEGAPDYIVGTGGPWNDPQWNATLAPIPKPIPPIRPTFPPHWPGHGKEPMTPGYGIRFGMDAIRGRRPPIPPPVPFP